jgi:hypothetical protein
MSVASLKKFLVGYWETNNHRNPPKNVNLFAGKNWAEELKTACTSETVRYIYELSMSSPIAQLVEQMTVNHWVAGSSPAWGASRKPTSLMPSQNSAFSLTVFIKSIL